VDPYLPAPFPEGLPTVLDQVEFSGAERAWRNKPGVAGLRHRLTYEKSARYWRGRLARYSTLTAVSLEEADAIRRMIGAETVPVVVAANGVDLAAYPPRDSTRATPGRMIYNGGLGYRPNADAVRWFVRGILPEVTRRFPPAHLVVTGRGDIPEAREFDGVPGVRLTGFLPDLRDALAEASVCVTPLLEGGGTRLKILEAWAAGLPVVSTTVGAAGLGGADGTHLRLADDAGTFAERTVALLSDPAEGARLAQNARRRVEESFGWAAIGAELAGVLSEMIASGRTASTTRA
jgi:polysaccharide biosynthesis protein PslH